MTRHTPKPQQPEKAAGLEDSDAATLQRWRDDEFSQAPYQYSERNLVVGRKCTIRRIHAHEEERLAGWPEGWTNPLTRAPHCNSFPRHEVERKRKRLLGNAWHGSVALWWFSLLVLPVLTMEQSLERDRRPTFWPEVLRENSCSSDQACRALEELRTSCPFTEVWWKYSHSSFAMDGDMPASLGPDWAEQNAMAASSLASGQQTRKQSFAFSKRKMIPDGLPPEDHFVLGT